MFSLLQYKGASSRNVEILLINNESLGLVVKFSEELLSLLSYLPGSKHNLNCYYCHLKVQCVQHLGSSIHRIWQEYNLSIYL